MRVIKEFLELFIVSAILAIVVWFVFLKKPVKTIEYIYDTDTVYVPEPYEVPKPYSVATPPITITKFLIDSSIIERYELAIRDKDLIIKGLEDSLVINNLYLTQYPSNPKILSMGLKRDTIKLGFLEIAGNIEEYKTPIDLNRYSYRWNLLDGFTRRKVAPTLSPPTLEEPFANYFVGGGVDLWHMMPQVSFRAEKQVASIRLYIDTRVGLFDIDRSNLSVGIEYQINGKIRN